MFSHVRMGSLTLISTVSLFFLAVLLLAVLVWGANASREPYQQLLTYSELTQTVEAELRGGINHYLESGDALVLNAVEKTLQQIVEVQLAQLPTEAVQQANRAASELQKYVSGELRAAGKLSGDSQGLLHQAERELSNSISLVNDYAMTAPLNKSQQGLQFASYAADLFELLKRLGYARERYFTSGEETYLKEIENIVNQSSAIVSKLEQLPRMNIYLEKEDEFALGDDEPEEMLDTPLSDLSSLFNRYQREVENTTELIQTRQQTHQKTYQLLDDFDTAMSDVVAKIDRRSNEITSLVQIGSLIVVGLFLSLVAVVQFSQYRFVGMVMQFVPHLKRYAEGNMQGAVDFSSRFEEIGELKEAANRLRSQMIVMISQIKAEAQKVNHMGERFVSSFQLVHDNSLEQQQQTQLSSSAINQMHSSFSEVALSASRAAEATIQADQSVVKGSETVQVALNNIVQLTQQIADTSKLISDLKNESDKIESVLSVIESVAEQTNLLALNAAIEAARAGDSGRGFAVVAEEVRGLAMRTSESTREIKQNIQTLQQVSGSAVATMDGLCQFADDTSSSTSIIDSVFQSVVKEINTIRDMNASIASTTEQQLAVVAEINQNIHRINDMSGETVEYVKGSMGDSEQMSLSSHQLMTSVGSFSI